MIREFDSFEHVLAIKPGLKTCAWAALRQTSGNLIACGLVQPFAFVDLAKAVFDVRNRLQKAWQKEVGFSTNPKVMAIETPPLYDVIKGKTQLENAKAITFLLGVLTEKMRAENTYLPMAKSWRGHLSDDKLIAKVLAKLNTNSKSQLAEDIHVIHKPYRQQVYDAVALGLWAHKKWRRESSPRPRMAA